MSSNPSNPNGKKSNQSHWDTATLDEIQEGLQRLRREGPPSLHAKKGTTFEIPVHLSPRQHYDLNMVVAAYGLAAQRPVSRSLVIRHAIEQLAVRVMPTINDPVETQVALAMLMKTREVIQ